MARFFLKKVQEYYPAAVGPSCSFEHFLHFSLPLILYFANKCSSIDNADDLIQTWIHSCRGRDRSAIL